LGWLFLQCTHLVTTSDFVSLNWLFVAQLQSWSSSKTSTGPSWLLSANTTGNWFLFVSHPCKTMLLCIHTSTGTCDHDFVELEPLELALYATTSVWTTMEWLNDSNAQHIKTFHHISHDVFQKYLSRAFNSSQTTAMSICSTNIPTT
jgi:hypothetical protein